jgi:hypothetical protein
MVDQEQTRKVLAAFERKRVQYVIFGAVALILQGLARAAEELDVFVAPTEESIGRFCAALTVVFDDPHIEEITARTCSETTPPCSTSPQPGTLGGRMP